MNTQKELQNISLKVREHIIRLSGDGGCFIGASLSAVDILVFLYKRFLTINDFQDIERDYFFLSKGHDVPALYGLFVELGWLKSERLKNHLRTTDNIYWHPNTSIPGIEFHSGSLGHLLPVSVGVAMDIKISKLKNKVVVMTGDGELNEGSNWEALLVAAAHKLDNLIVIVDRNMFQANMATEELIPLEPLKEKFEAFGAECHQCDGHDFFSIEKTFKKVQFNNNKPKVIISRTIRGKGLPSIESKADRWFCNFNNEEIENLLEELHGNNLADLSSKTLTVR